MFSTVFNLNEPERQLIAKPILPHGKIVRVIFPLFWFTKSLLVSIQKAYSVLDKNTNARHFWTTVGYIFSKHVHCDMRFLVEDFSALLCFLDGFDIAVSVFSYLEPSSSAINCIITAPDCDPPNGTKSSNFMNYCLCSAHFSKGKMLYFPLEFCIFQ